MSHPTHSTHSVDTTPGPYGTAQRSREVTNVSRSVSSKVHWEIWGDLVRPSFRSPIHWTCPRCPEDRDHRPRFRFRERSNRADGRFKFQTHSVTMIGLSVGSKELPGTPGSSGPVSAVSVFSSPFRLQGKGTVGVRSSGEDVGVVNHDKQTRHSSSQGQ